MPRLDKQAQDGLFALYGGEFYKSQMDVSYLSARKYALFLYQLFRPKRVVDVGCGRGMWLRAFKEAGACYLVGYDGPWITQQDIGDSSIRFVDADLNDLISRVGDERFDLAMSLEVAEHLDPLSATEFVEALTKMSDVVMFSAAYEYQGGTNHINEQKHSYWARKFADFDYAPFDIFRPAFWDDVEVGACYRQNTFLYIKNGAALSSRLEQSGYVPLKNIRFMDCVHPDFYQEKILDATLGAIVKNYAKAHLPARIQSLIRRISTRR